MDITGYVILTAEQAAAWQAAYPEEYADYIAEGLFDEDERFLYDLPEWMNDYDDSNGPFDFGLHPSQATWGD